MKTLARRLAKLEALVPPLPSPEVQLRYEQCDRLFALWDRLVAAAWPLMTPEEQGRVHQGIKQLHEGALEPYGAWFTSLVEGWSRLPELTPQVMKDLLVIWVYHTVAGAFVCLDCGLEYPFRQWPRLSGPGVWLEPPGGHAATPLPEFFTTCPHCGSTNKEIAGSDRVEQHDFPFKHLDGYVAPLPPALPRGQP